MAGEQHPMPNAGRHAAPGSAPPGFLGTLKLAGGAAKELLDTWRKIEAVAKRTEESAKRAAQAQGTATGAGRVRHNGGVGSSTTRVMDIASVAPAPRRGRDHSPGRDALADRVAAGESPNGGRGFGSGLPTPASPRQRDHGSSERGPGSQGYRQMQAVYGGGVGNYMAHLGEQSAPFVLPNAIGRMTANVRQYAEAARGENYLANRFAVGSSVGAGGTSRYENGMYQRMAAATFGGAENAQDRQQGLYTLHQNFSTQAIFGSGAGVMGGGRGGGTTMAGQMVGLSQANPGMGAAGAARQLAALNNPQLINMARAYGVQLRSVDGPNKGAVNFEAVANDLIDRMYGPNPTADETDVAYSFQPGNASYANLQQMGFDDESISNVQRIVQGRARTGWARAQLGDSSAARQWRQQAGLGTELSQTSLTREGERAARDATTTSGEVSGLAMTNRVLGDIHGVLKDIFEAVQPLTTAVGGVGGALGGSSGLTSAATSAAGVGGNYLVMRALLARMGGGAAGAGAGGAAAAGGLRAATALGARALGAAGLVGLGLNAGQNALNDDPGKRGTGERLGNAAATVGKYAAAGAAGGAPFGGPVGAAIGAVGGTLLGSGKSIYDWYWGSNRAAGGVVPGDHHNDTVPIQATPGEVVVPTHTVKKHGGASKLMQKLGFSGGGGPGGYAKGGEVIGDTGELHPEFLKRLKAFSAAVGQPFRVDSGGRTFAEQQVLYDRWMRKVPGQAKAAKPGSSNHNYGLAADGSRWRDKNPEKYGLRYPMDYEPWHIEPTNAKAMRGEGVGSGATGVAGKEQTSSVYRGNFFSGGLASALVAIMRSFGAPKGVGAVAGTAAGAATAAAAGAGGAPSDPKGNAAIGKAKAEARGWKGKEWDALYQLWQKESGWRTEADNPGSSAYGIPQALIALHDVPQGYYGTKTGSGPRTNAKGGNPAVQIDWGLDYIKDRYGTPSRAWAHHQKRGSYSQGAWETKNEIAQLHQGEMVIPAKVADGVRTALREHGAGIASRGSGAGATVNIYLTVQKATEAEARRFAGVVKGQLESSNDLSQVAMS